MTKRKQSPTVVQVLLNDPRVRQAHQEGHAYYSINDLIRVVTDGQKSDAFWSDLKRREPKLAEVERSMEVEQEGQFEVIPMADLSGALRIIQSMSSPQAERVKRWLAESAVERLEELENPELTLVRMRRDYADRGYSPKWIDKRLRGISVRQELTSEWARRGVTDSDQYRALTNAVMAGTFGMDVESLRRYKNLQRTTQNLRDYMGDLELVLTSLGESAAVALHRNRGSYGFDDLIDDASEAGRIAGAARTQIEQGSTHRPARNENRRARAG